MVAQKKKINKPFSSEVEEKKEKEGEEKSLEIESFPEEEQGELLKEDRPKTSQAPAEEPSESITDTTDSVEGGKKLLWIILPAILLLGGLAGGVFIFKEGIKKTEKTEEQLVVVSPSPTTPIL